MQKFATYLLAASLALESFFMPVSALAQTATTSPQGVSALIAQLETQIKVLEAQIKALREAQGNIVSTLQLLAELREGMTGEQVTLLQTILAADSDIYPEGIISGFYGRLTSNAVKRFQKKHGLSQVGRVGPLTLRELNNLLKQLDLGEKSDNDDEDDDGDRNEKRFCAKIPPGHLIAPGWLRKHNGVRPIVPECQKLPPGIINNPNASTTPPGTPPANDTTAPVISGIMSTSTSSTGTVIKWNTNEFATGHVWYGTTTPFTLFNGSNILVKDHSVSVSGLTASTTYMFVAVSRDLAGNTATSTQQSFTTQ